MVDEKWVLRTSSNSGIIKAMINNCLLCSTMSMWHEAILRFRTFCSSGNLQVVRELSHEEDSDNSGKDDPESIRKNPIDNERLPIIVACLAP